MRGILPLLLGVALPFTLSADPLVFTFDDDKSAEAAADIGPLSYHLAYHYPGSVKAERKEVKFGTGALRIERAATEHPVDGLIWQPIRDYPRLCDAINRMTLSVWVRLPEDHDSGGFQIVRRDQNHSNGDETGYFSFVYNSRMKALRFDAAGHTPVNAKVQLAPGQWQHLAVTYEEGTVTFYENGIPHPPLAAKGDTIGEIPQRKVLTLFKAFGSLPAGTLVDDLYCDFTRALSADEMSRLAESGAAKFIGKDAR